MTAFVLPGLEDAGLWQVRNRADSAAVALANRHYSRSRLARYSSQVGGPGRVLVLVTPCERAFWVTRWNTTRGNADGLDAWRNMYFRREEGAPRASDLIRAAMDLTAALWTARPADGWVTWIDTRKVASPNPGYCYKQAGWYVDHQWKHPHLVRLRASVPRVALELRERGGS